MRVQTRTRQSPLSPFAALSASLSLSIHHPLSPIKDTYPLKTKHTSSLSHQQTDVPVRDPVRRVFGAHICVCWRGSERRGKGNGRRVGQQQRCQQSPCSPTIPCTSVSVIYRSTVSSIYTAPACSPQQILLIVSRMQQPCCDSSSLGMCCFLSVCSQSLVLYSSDYLHCVSLVIVLYAAQCTVALAHCASYRLPPSLPSLSLSSCFSLFQTTVIITLHTALRRGEHIRVNPFCLAALMFVAMLCWSIKTDTATHEALKSGSLKCVFWAMIYSSFHSALGSLTWDRAAQL